MTRRDPQQLRLPVERAAEVRDHDDERALKGEAADERQRFAEAAAAGRRVAHRAECEQQFAASLTRTPEAGRAVAERDDTEPVPAPARHMPERDRHAFGDVGLSPVGRSEAHRCGRVEHEPGHEHPLGKLDADVGLACARGHVPVDASHVVARLVRHAPGGAPCRFPPKRRAIVAGEHAADAPADREVERTQAVRSERARPGLGRCPDAVENIDDALAHVVPFRLCGACCLLDPHAATGPQFKVDLDAHGWASDGSMRHCKPQMPVLENFACLGRVCQRRLARHRPRCSSVRAWGRGLRRQIVRYGKIVLARCLRRSSPRARFAAPT